MAKAPGAERMEEQDWVTTLPGRTVTMIGYLQERIEEAQRARTLEEVHASLSEAMSDLLHLKKLADLAYAQLERANPKLS